MSKKAFENLLNKIKDAPGFPVNLNFQVGEHTFSGHGSSGKTLKDDRFTITAYTIVAKHVSPLATVRFNRKSWAEFVKMGDGLLNGYRRYAKKERAKKKKKK